MNYSITASLKQRRDVDNFKLRIDIHQAPEFLIEIDGNYNVRTNSVHYTLTPETESQLEFYIGIQYEEVLDEIVENIENRTITFV